MAQHEHMVSTLFAHRGKGQLDGIRLCKSKYKGLG